MSDQTFFALYRETVTETAPGPAPKGFFARLKPPVPAEVDVVSEPIPGEFSHLELAIAEAERYARDHLDPSDPSVSVSVLEVRDENAEVRLLVHSDGTHEKVG